MNSNPKDIEYYDQLALGISEMKATIERLRKEIYELNNENKKIKALNNQLKTELREAHEDYLFWLSDI